jgi:hypothetical protein
MSQAIAQAVKAKYGAVATGGLSTEHPGVRAGFCRSRRSGV